MWRYNPACAGTTPARCPRLLRCTIQPRVCGDYVILTLRVPEIADTTPRVRGLQIMKLVTQFKTRYNPACAGTTVSLNMKAICMPIQPRVCGDYLFDVASKFCPVDTTPRVRGLRCPALDTGYRHRYNPACAGTTSRSRDCVRVPSIQPRVCGDYLDTSPDTVYCGDTTPRVRGLRRAPVSPTSRHRYNPACAGTT